MATRTKTTWWGFPTDTASVNNSTLRTFATQTVYVDSTTRTFRSAIVEVYVQDRCTVTGATIGESRIGVNVGGAGATTVTELDDLTHSGENNSFFGWADFTQQFIDHFGSNTSNTVVITCYIDMSTGTTLTTMNACAVLKLTYDFDDAASICVKTITIPIESNTAGFANVLTEVGTNQIPILTGASGLIKEVSAPTIRDWFIICDGNENKYGDTTNFTPGFSLDSDAATSMGIITRVFGSERFNRYVFSKKSAVPTTTATHAFKVISDAASGSSMHHMSFLLVVTYEFTRANASATTNSIQIPFTVPDQGGTSAGDQQVVRIPFDIEEPGNVTLLQSGVQVWWDLPGAMNTSGYFSVQVGARTARTYTSNVYTASLCGSLVLMQRIDSRAAGSGTAVTLQRGQCYVDVNILTAAQSTVAGISGILYLTYSTDSVPSTGIDSCNHTIYKNIQNWDFLINTEYNEIAATAMTLIGDANYWIQAAGLWVAQYWNGITGTPWAMLYAEILSTEGVLGVADGWREMGSLYPSVLSESATYPWGINRMDLFKRHPTDPKLYQMDITTSRKWRMISPRGCSSIQSMVTYHAITFTITGVVTGYAGTGAVTVSVHDATSGEFLYTLTASAGGSYTATIYDNTRNHFSEVYENATHVGRSANWTAS